MRAVVCRKLGTPADLTFEELPEPSVGPGEIQVDMRAMGLNFVDVLMVAGGYQLKPDLPFVPGLEGAGIVRAVSADVADIRVGDRVMTAHRPGALAEVTVVAAKQARRIPDGVGFAAAAVFRSAYHTAYHALVQRGRLQPGETLLVHGASGGVGLAAVHVGKLLGARVIATGASDDKLSVVKAEGADHVVNLTDGFRDAVKDLTGGRGVNVVYDPVGGDVFDESMRCLAWGARLLVVGFAGGRAAAARTNHLLIKGASVLGLRAGEVGRRDPRIPEANMAVLLDWLATGKIRPHISHRIPLERYAEGMQAISDRRVVGRVVLETSLE